MNRPTDPCQEVRLLESCKPDDDVPPRLHSYDPTGRNEHVYVIWPGGDRGYYVREQAKKEIDIESYRSFFSSLCLKKEAGTRIIPTLAGRVQAARKVKGLTQAEVSKASGMTQQSFWALESGASSGSQYIVHIARVLGVSAEWLVFGDGV